MRAEKRNDLAVAADPKRISALVGEALPGCPRRYAEREKLLDLCLREAPRVRASKTLTLADAVNVADGDHEPTVAVTDFTKTAVFVEDALWLSVACLGLFHGVAHTSMSAGCDQGHKRDDNE